MARLSESDTAAAAAALERALADAFRSEGWHVEEQPVLGTARPDLLISRPSGEQIVVEVKATRSPIHFGDIAQLTAYARLAETTRQLSDVRTALFTTGTLSAAARDAAEQLGVFAYDDDRLNTSDPLPADIEAVAKRWAAALNNDGGKVAS